MKKADCRKIRLVTEAMSSNETLIASIDKVIVLWCPSLEEMKPEPVREMK